MEVCEYKEKFIKNAIKKHYNKYNYENIDYINNYTKIKIYCYKHGYFYQTPNSHLNGSGCPECGNVKKLTTEKFVEKSKKIHNIEYDYSLVVYTNNKTNVIIICKKHGKFTQAPHAHLKGQGCPKCFGTNSKTLSKEEFIEKSKKIHGDKYSYKKVIFVNNNSKLYITCRRHGDFTQTPYNHLKGHGCPNCAITKKLTKEEFIEIEII
jgi:Zn finger protein HypA/HybF involved in hydrogenase expression